VKKILIAGIGNILRSDDGIGIRVTEILQSKDLPSNVDIIEGTSGIDLIGAFKGYDRVVIVDAMKTNREPGSIEIFSLGHLHVRGMTHPFSSHDLDISGLLNLGKKIFPDHMPDDVVIVGIEADDVTTFSDSCTPRVEKAAGIAVKMIEELIAAQS